jgi:hypothetical protein
VDRDHDAQPAVVVHRVDDPLEGPDGRVLEHRHDAPAPINSARRA